MSFLDTLVFGTLGRGAVELDMLNATYVLTEAEAAFAILVNGDTTAMTAGRTLKLPNVARMEDAYMKFVRNDNGAGFAVTVIDETGGTSVAIADARGAWVWVTPTGVRRMTADTA